MTMMSAFIDVSACGRASTRLFMCVCEYNIKPLKEYFFGLILAQRIRLEMPCSLMICCFHHTFKEIVIQKKESLNRRCTYTRRYKQVINIRTKLE